jgi:hypothetical protein
MFEKLKVLYLANRISDYQLERAVEKGWITQEQMEIIKGLK